jgi:hypothetical protein
MVWLLSYNFDSFLTLFDFDIDRSIFFPSSRRFLLPLAFVKFPLQRSFCRRNGFVKRTFPTNFLLSAIDQTERIPFFNASLQVKGTSCLAQRKVIHSSNDFSSTNIILAWLQRQLISKFNSE